MGTSSFEATVRRHSGVAVIEMRGDIDALAEDTLNAAYAETAGQDAAPILLNFKDVTYVNSTGIALIVSLLAQARKSHRPVLACGLSDHYQEIFHITRLADFMSIFPDEAAAIADAPAAVDG